jgi:hypothetical protein
MNDEENNLIINDEVVDIPEKKKRGRKKKEDLLKIEMEQKRLEDEANNKKKEEIDPVYYSERNEYKNILLAAFLTRWRNINYNHIRDNDGIISDGVKILDEVKTMSDIEYGTYYKMLLRNINREDIFDSNDYFF